MKVFPFFTTFMVFSISYYEIESAQLFCKLFSINHFDMVSSEALCVA